MFRCFICTKEWSLSESSLHINILEIKAIKYTLVSLCKNVSNFHLCVKSDSATAVSYINRKGGSVMSLFIECKEIWLWCCARKIHISAVHVKGKENLVADYLSQVFSDSTEWKLNEDVFL